MHAFAKLIDKTYNMIRKLLLFSLLIMGISSLYAQVDEASYKAQRDTSNYPYWIDMMQDPQANFYDVQKAFNTYWEGREITRSCGWKPFKRWEYFMSTRVKPDGSRYPEDELIKAYKTYESMASVKQAGAWNELGPIHQPANNGTGQPNGLGRVNAIAFHPTNANILYIGAPAGGLWRSEDGGENWSSSTDNLPSLGVSSVVVDRENPTTIYIGTGDRDAGDANGLGVMKSTDSGETFTSLNEGMGEVIVGRLIQHPTNADIMLAATSEGIYKTTNRGTSWAKTSAMGGHYKDILFKPGDPSIIYATASGRFFRSDDTGDNWTNITNGITNGARGVIGVSPAQPNWVYFFTTNSATYKATYRSTDGGLTFTTRSTTPNVMGYSVTGSDDKGQAWYDLDIAIDPQNADIIYAGGVNCFKSSDGASTWQLNSHWVGDGGVPAVHADLHVLEFNPLNNRLFAGNDGGLYYTDNGGTSWPEISSGLAIAQIYRIGQSATVKNRVINGYQDNGTAMYGDEFITIQGGDGMEGFIDWSDQQYSFGSYYYGNVIRHFNNGYQGQVAGPDVNGINESGGWVTPFIQHHTDANTMFLGMRNVWRSNNIKANYAGSVNWDKISDFGSSELTELEQSPANTDILYAITGNNKIYRSNNVNSVAPEWVSLPLPATGKPTDIVCDPHDAEVVYMTLDRKVFRSEDRGNNWVNITGSLPDVNFNCLIAYRNSAEGLYLGTDLGVYYTDATMDEWIAFGQGLPLSVKITELDIWYDTQDASQDEIRAATYGRGLWSSKPYLTTPQPNFTSSLAVIPTGGSIDFTDKTLGVTSNWLWTFEGGTPATSAERNPQNIQYNNEGSFDVKLKVWNDAGKDSIIKQDYVTVSSSILPVIQFSANDTIICNGGKVSFTDESIYNPTSWLWSFTPDNVTFIEGTSATSANPIVQFDNSGSYDVELTATNENGSSSLKKEQLIAVGGAPLPFIEDFENTDLENGAWRVENPDNDKTWKIASVGGSATGSKAMMMPMRYYMHLTEKDRLISPAINLSGTIAPALTFSHAYANRFGNTDTLWVYISDDCGTTWTKIYTGAENGEGSFATHAPFQGEFIPQEADDWCGSTDYAPCNYINLSAWAGKENVRLMFETFNKSSNNLFIDNITVQEAVGIESSVSNSPVNIYPNPNNGMMTIDIPSANEELMLTVQSIDGRSVFHKLISGTNAKSTSLDLRHLNKGSYFIILKGKDLSHTTHVVIN